MGKLDGKVALITGSGRNIGRATALMMAAEGANIVVNARRNRAEADATAAAVAELGVRALPVLADVSQKDQVDAMLDAARSAFGRIDILVNNAAIRPHKPFTELTVADWEQVRGVVLDGAFYTTHGRHRANGRQQLRTHRLSHRRRRLSRQPPARPCLRRQKWASSVWRAAWPPEFAPHNIRVNVVSPGSIDTTRANPEWYAGRVPDHTGIPLGRQGNPAEIAAAVTFLCTDDAGFITGQTIHANGGQGYFG